MKNRALIYCAYKLKFLTDYSSTSASSAATAPTTDETEATTTTTAMITKSPPANKKNVSI